MAEFPTARDGIRIGSPRWLQARFGEALLYSWGLVADGLTEILTLATKARFPLDGMLEAVGAVDIVGRDRRIPRGVNEPEATYADRLVPWFERHSRRGNPYALLGQVRARYAAAPFDVELIYPQSGKRYTMLADGSPIMVDTVTAAPSATQPFQWLLVYHWPALIAHDGTWAGPGVWDDGGVWDFEFSAAEAEMELRVPSDWNAAHAIGYLALLDDVNVAAFWDFPGGSWADGVWTVGGDSALVLRVPNPVVLI
jgi:hypothetical protein